MGRDIISQSSQEPFVRVKSKDREPMTLGLFPNKPNHVIKTAGNTSHNKIMPQSAIQDISPKKPLT